MEMISTHPTRDDSIISKKYIIASSNCYDSVAIRLLIYYHILPNTALASIYLREMTTEEIKGGLYFIARRVEGYF